MYYSFFCFLLISAFLLCVYLCTIYDCVLTVTYCRFSVSLLSVKYIIIFLKKIIS